MGNLKPGVTYVYESPDGGETVYAREQGAPVNTRIMIGQSYNAKVRIEERKEEELWKEIRAEAKYNVQLQEAINRVKVLYYLSKDKDGSET